MRQITKISAFLSPHVLEKIKFYENALKLNIR